MADLFEGAPEAWIRSAGEDGIDLNLFDWIYRKATTNRPPEWLQGAGEAAYQGMSRMMGGGPQQAPMAGSMPTETAMQQKQPPYMDLRASIMRGNQNGG